MGLVLPFTWTSANLLASIVSVLMRATGQVQDITGGLSEPERRLVASRAILGEWLGGSGGGWQDSGGVWPAGAAALHLSGVLLIGVGFLLMHLDTGWGILNLLW